LPEALLLTNNDRGSPGSMHEITFTTSKNVTIQHMNNWSTNSQEWDQFSRKIDEKAEHTR